MSLPVHLAPSLTGVAPGETVEVTGDEAHHAVAVRRLRVGETVVLTDGAGTSVTGPVGSTGKRVFTVRVDDVRREPRPQPELVVVQALPKGDRGELAVEVLTEVGVALVVPWAAARSVAVWKGERAERSRAKWQATAREAAKQARRSWLPEVAALARTAEVVDLVAGADLALVLHEGADDALVHVDVPSAGRIVLVVGPEGGLSEAEVAALVGAGARSVRLGDEVLRTSTAGVVAAAAVLARTPRWG
ncbi:16S rRNA (uracil(1498)-N(3))-methyltransferase [Nocardioides euryhalodurans]|uniref:Ribosomal RNA small subunit methyltransferase E n=1 Tax=Nocardioides euryhalodurans TaxID=2518370 RepID=A0A4V1BDM5_9ACTN|nr:16S rRNA (uracil(1498)-N(3))-methyltransferase [Nocardioides euryhalodurans]QBR91642.1 16S rRNA (uracil(1498)-N(3))-methyltransferase [Nocardioides euryhalodurans]